METVPLKPRLTLNQNLLSAQGLWQTSTTTGTSTYLRWDRALRLPSSLGTGTGSSSKSQLSPFHAAILVKCLRRQRISTATVISTYLSFLKTAETALPVSLSFWEKATAPFKRVGLGTPLMVDTEPRLLGTLTETESSIWLFQTVRLWTSSLETVTARSKTLSPIRQNTGIRLL